MPAFARRKFTTLFCACLMAGLNFLSGCSNTPLTDQLLKQPPADLSVRRDLQSVPFFPQDAYQCGPAALATLLRHRDIQTEPDKLTDRVYLPARRGSLQVEMIATARSFGLLTYPLKPDLYQVLKEVDAGNPVLVFQNLSLPFWPQWHYAVVAGYDLPQRELILRSGTIARHRISFRTFERTWQRAGHWAWLLVKPGEVPITAEPLIYTRSAHQLDKAGFQYEALMALRSGARVWPQASIALMALGNAEYLAGNIESANAAFIQEIKQRRDNAAAWNNLAYGLSASQCHHQALAAISCALQQQPDNENYRRSAREIENLASKPLNTRSPQSTVLHQCAIPACPPVDQDN